MSWTFISKYTSAHQVKNLHGVLSLVLLLFLTSCGGFVTNLASLAITTTGTRSVVTTPSDLSYDTNLNIYVYNDASAGLTANITSNNPTVVGTVTGFSISPNLATNTGLSFDTTTGIISGKPTLTSAATDYTITAAKTGGGIITSVVNIRTAPGFVVNSNGDATDSSTADNACLTAGSVCTLRAALVQNNAMSSTSRVILVPAPMTITTGSTLTISDNTEVIGDSQTITVIDAAAGAYHALTISGASTTAIIGALTVQNSAWTGIYVTNATLTMNDLIVQNHISGGIYADTSAIFTLNRSIVRNNSSSGVNCYTTATCTIRNSSITQNNSAAASGGGISTVGTLVIDSSYIAENSARSYGGGLFVHSFSNTTSITNSTFYNNSADIGGAIDAQKAISITNSTFANNYSTYYSAAYGAIAGSLTLKNVVFNNNHDANGDPKNCSAISTTITSAGYNLSDTSIADCNLNATGDVVSADALLSAPADNGGYTYTMAPTSGSVALDGGTSSGAPVTDQRGEARPNGAAYDMGAYEGAASGTQMDTTAPNNATAMGWSIASPSTSTSITASWNVSNSGDLASQKILTYTGAGCGAPNAYTIEIPSAVTNTYTFTGADQTIYSYRITSEDSSGNITRSGCSSNMLVSVPPSSLSYSTPTAIYVYNDASAGLSPAITNNTPTLTGTATGYAISPALPTGLSIHATTGVISGTPSATVAATNYTVTASNAGGSTNATVNIRTGPGFVVNNSGDATDSSTADNACSTAGAVCTLRAAVVQINAMSATSRLILIPAMTIIPTSVITLNNNMEIIGTTEASTIIDANAAAIRILQLSSGTISLSKMTIKNTTDSGGAGSCMNQDAGTLYLSDVTVRDCIPSAGISETGAGLYLSGVGVLTRTSWINNHVSGAFGQGGAILMNATATLTISDSLFDGNSASYGGGALRLAGLTNPLIQHSLFINNQGGSGGGAVTSTCAMDTASIENSTFYNNSSGSGGAIQFSSVNGYQILNSTFVANTATVAGQGGAIAHNCNSATVKNSIFADNQAAGVDDSCRGPVASGNYNLSDTASSDCGFSGTGDLASTDPLLSALAANGGATQTMAITSASPAYRTGNPATCASDDQRGTSRHLPTACDMGAFEVP